MCCFPLIMGKLLLCLCFVWNSAPNVNQQTARGPYPLEPKFIFLSITFNWINNKRTQTIYESFYGTRLNQKDSHISCAHGCPHGSLRAQLCMKEKKLKEWGIYCSMHRLNVLLVCTPNCTVVLCVKKKILMFLKALYHLKCRNSVNNSRLMKVSNGSYKVNKIIRYFRIL